MVLLRGEIKMRKTFSFALLLLLPAPVHAKLVPEWFKGICLIAVMPLVWLGIYEYDKKFQKQPSPDFKPLVKDKNG